MTVHYVTNELNFGMTILQLAMRVAQLEKENAIFRAQVNKNTYIFTYCTILVFPMLSFTFIQ